MPPSNPKDQDPEELWNKAPITEYSELRMDEMPGFDPELVRKTVRVSSLRRVASTPTTQGGPPIFRVRVDVACRAADALTDDERRIAMATLAREYSMYQGQG